MTRLALSLCAALAIAGCGTSVVPKPASSPVSGPANKRAAERDAGRLLQSAVLPPGSVRVSVEPRGDGRLLRNAPEASTGLLVDRSGWWRTSRSLASVVAFIKSHPPAGSARSGSGQQGGPGVPHNHLLGFSLTPVQGVTSSRGVLFESAALRGGGTGIRIDAQEIWLLARPAGERVPAGVHEITVVKGWRGRPPLFSRAVSAPAKVRKIVAWLDALPIVQPAAISCAALPAAPRVTFQFRAAPAGRLLAQASMGDYSFSSDCNPVAFSIGGVPQKPLMGGEFLGRVQRLLGVRLH